MILGAASLKVSDRRFADHASALRLGPANLAICPSSRRAGFDSLHGGIHPPEERRGPVESGLIDYLRLLPRPGFSGDIHPAKGTTIPSQSGPGS